MTVKTTMLVALLLLPSSSELVAAEEAVFVEKGNARLVREIGAKWMQKDGALVCGGTGNYLVTEKAVGAGDFRIRARLSLERLDGTAASLVIGGNHFGFDGSGKKLFVEGPALGLTRLLADSQKFITSGKPFEVEVVRKGTTLTFRIDGKEVHSGQYKLAPVCAIGLRPWRATMRIHDFSADGDLVPVTDAAIKTLQQDHKKVNRPSTQRGGIVTIGGVKIDPASPPKGLALRPDLGILAAEAIQGKVIHRSGKIVWVPRATVTPKGDYLVLFPHDRGQWYQGKEMLAYRSSDKGKTWVGPTVAFDSSQSHHGFVPLIPRGSERMYAFGTQPIPGMVGASSKGLHENCPIGFRYSDDDGHTWSKVTLIRPENDPEFVGMSCVRMCETDKGTWLIGSHDGIWRRKGSPAPVTTRQYILRSEDKGKTWTLLPGKRPDGWHLEKYDRMDEGTVVSLGGEKAAVFIRTAEGHIWESRSDDDGRTWSAPKPTTMVHPDAPPMIFKLGDGKTLISFIHNRYDPRKPHFDKAARNELWCSISKDEGRTWNEPRFVFAGATSGGHIHSNSYIDMFADGSRIHIFLGQYGRQLIYLGFDESDLPKFLTKAELTAAAQNPLAKTITVGGVEFDPKSPPQPLVLRQSLGLITAQAVDGRLVHEAATNLYETRATITPKGDYLLMFPEGAHYGGRKGKVNTMIAYRSSDKGKTWTGPKAAFDIDYSQHGFIPLIPKKGKRIYAFGTQPIEGKREGRENCPIGFRFSDDDGLTWSDVTLIRATNNPDFLGMSVMRMCETDAGTWLLGSHEGLWKRTPKTPVITRAYVLRSDDQGTTWTVHPKPRPGGWFLEKYDRMDEPRPIHLGGGKVLVLARSCSGRLWEIRSNDDGRTWTEPKPTTLVHPDAPPMLFHHPDGKTLMAFHHNRHSGSHFKQTDRSEIWLSLSTDQGRTWSEPRFVFANALAATSKSAWHDHQCSYLDAFTDGQTIHMFVPHRWKRALHLTLKAGDIGRLPTKAGLKAAARVEKTLLFGAGEDGYAVFRIPGIVVTTKGTVLAYCVGRKSPGDWADIDIFLRRSTDGGKTWEPRKKLGDVGASTVDNPTAIVDRKTGAVHMLYQVNYARCYYMRSDDDGNLESTRTENQQ